jgi:ribosomal protein S18 acetylase RimI-like enzyme
MNHAQDHPPRVPAVITTTLLAPEHAPAYRALMLEAYSREPDAFTSTAEERAQLPMEWWEKRLGDNDDSLVLGALEDGKLVGAVGMAFEQREKTRHKASVFGMYVAPIARGRGAGRALIHQALAAARQTPGIELVVLTVSDGNQSAIALYERAGFRTFGIEPKAIRVGDRFIAKVHMACQISR